MKSESLSYFSILKKIIQSENFIVFMLCFAAIFGAAFALFDSYNYDMDANPDIKTYLGLANFDFDQSHYRRYRVIIPFLAAGINYLLGPIFNLLKPSNFPGPDFSLCMSFLLVNCLFMSIFGTIVYRLCKEFHASTLGATIGVLSVLSCRWTPYLAGLPMIDSLYLVIAGMMLLGIKTKNSTLIVLTIFIGPWAKESFIFIAPLIFFFSSINKWKQIILFALSFILIFSFRYYYDVCNNFIATESIGEYFSLINNINDSLKRLFSFHGAYEIFSIFGIWGLLFFFLVKKDIRTAIKLNTPFYLTLFLMMVLVQALLSTELARMFYMATPVFAIWFSLIFDKIFNQKEVR